MEESKVQPTIQMDKSKKIAPAQTMEYFKAPDLTNEETGMRVEIKKSNKHKKLQIEVEAEEIPDTDTEMGIRTPSNMHTNHHENTKDIKHQDINKTPNIPLVYETKTASYTPLKGMHSVSTPYPLSSTTTTTTTPIYTTTNNMAENLSAFNTPNRLNANENVMYEHLGNSNSVSSPSSQNSNENNFSNNNTSNTRNMRIQQHQYSHYPPSTPSPYDNNVNPMGQQSRPGFGGAQHPLHSNLQHPYGVISNSKSMYPPMNNMNNMIKTMPPSLNNIPPGNVANSIGTLMSPYPYPNSTAACHSPYFSSPPPQYRNPNLTQNSYSEAIVNKDDLKESIGNMQTPSRNTNIKLDGNDAPLTPVNTEIPNFNSKVNNNFNKFSEMNQFGGPNVNPMNHKNNSMNLLNPSPTTTNLPHPVHNNMNPLISSPNPGNPMYPFVPRGYIMNHHHGYPPSAPFSIYSPNQGMGSLATSSRGPIPPPGAMGVRGNQVLPNGSISDITNRSGTLKVESSNSSENPIDRETNIQDTSIQEGYLGSERSEIVGNVSRKRRLSFSAVYKLEPNKIHKMGDLCISHCKNDDGIDVLYFHCDQPGCHYKAKQKCDYTQHQRLVHEIGENIPWFFCDQMECTYKTKRKGDLKIHQRLVHMMGENIVWFHCDQPDCKYHSKNKNNLKQHKLLVHSVGENIVYFQCEQPGCDYTTKRKRDFTRHKMNIHSIGEEIIWFHCDQPHCTYKAKQKSNLTQHKRVIHDVGENIIRYLCDVRDCPYSTKIKGDLVRHQRLVHHIGDQIWFYCDYEGCNYRCNIKSSIKQHKRNIHEKDKKLPKLTTADTNDSNTRETIAHTTLQEKISTEQTP